VDRKGQMMDLLSQWLTDQLQCFSFPQTLL
jgi:hypothetical protein